MPIQFLPLPILFAFSPPYHLPSPSPIQQRITSIQQFGPLAAEFKQSLAPTAILTKHFEKRGKGFLSSGPEFSEWSRRHRERGRHGDIREDVEQINNRGDFEELQNSYESSRRRFEQLWHPTFAFPRGKLRKNLSPDSKRMRQLVEELQQLKQDEHEAKQLKQKQAKELNPKKVEKHENTTNKEGEKDDNRGAGKGGKYDNTGGDEKGGDISLTVVQRMNTVYMEGDDTTQGFHFRL